MMEITRFIFLLYDFHDPLAVSCKFKRQRVDNPGCYVMLDKPIHGSVQAAVHEKGPYPQEQVLL